MIVVRSFHRPCLSVLLVVLLAMWGTCPCVYAKMFNLAPPGPETTSAEAPASPAPTPAYCCKFCAPSSSSSPVLSNAADEAPPPSRDCPCCERGGWMRDLPPQAQALLLEAPTPAAFDVPCLAVTELVLDLVGETRATDTGPPMSQRPHASPVGIVRLLN